MKNLIKIADYNRQLAQEQIDDSQATFDLVDSPYTKMRTAFIRVSATNNTTKGIVHYTSELIKQELDRWSEKRKFRYYFIEHNDNPNNVHYHIVLDFPKKSIPSFQTVKNRFPYGDIKLCGSIKNCIYYLCHLTANCEDKYIYDWDEIITNSPDKLEEYKTQGQSTKFTSLIDMIMAGEVKECDIDKIDPKLYIRHSKQIKNAFEYYRTIQMKNPTRDVQVYVLQGPPGCGKSTFCKVWAQQHHKTICFSSGSRDYMQDYKPGTDILVLDDLDDTQLSYQDLIKAIDPYVNSSASSRYYNKPFTGDTIFICTNKNILWWFKHYEPNKDCGALYRRINYVLSFEKPIKGQSTYTINTIEQRVSVYNCSKEEYEDADYALVPISKNINVYSKTFDISKYVDFSSRETHKTDFLNSLDNL